jgi:hypothetical protein
MNATAWIFALVAVLWVPIVTVTAVRVRRERRQP